MTEGRAKAYWRDNPDSEARIEVETKATNRTIPQEQEHMGPAACMVCGEPAKEWSY